MYVSLAQGEVPLTCWGMIGMYEPRSIQSEDKDRLIDDKVAKLGNGRNTVREYCFGGENSLSSAANSVSSAKNSVSLLWHTNNRLRGTH